jgi:hypothetical protein
MNTKQEHTLISAASQSRPWHTSPECTAFILNRHEVNTNPFFPLSHHDFETILPTSASSNTAAPQDLNGKKTQFCTPQGHLFPAMT